MIAELLAIHAAAHTFYQERYPSSWVPGYLAQRGIGMETQGRWEIGYAPSAWRALTLRLRDAGFSDAALLTSGLVRRTRDGKRPFDAFRDRVMFPVRDPHGTIVGFIGRRPDRGDGPRYLNSPDTPIFHKGRLLFGLYEASGETRPVLVEGPLDAIAVQLAGLDGVAPSGTALTTEQASLLGPSVLLALDGDEAGRRGALNAWRHLAHLPGPIGAVLLPGGLDPADILRRDGPSELARALSAEIPLADLVVDAAIERHLGPFVEQQISAAHAAASVIAGLHPDDVARQVARVAARLDLDHVDVTRYVVDAVTGHPLPGRKTPPSPIPLTWRPHEQPRPSPRPDHRRLRP